MTSKKDNCIAEGCRKKDTCLLYKSGNGRDSYTIWASFCWNNNFVYYLRKKSIKNTK